MFSTEINKNPDDYCERVEDFSNFVKSHATHTKDNSIDLGRTISSREQSHWRGNCYSPLNGEQSLFALLGYMDIRSLEGRLLTIIDASFVDRDQRKAVKDLVRNAIWFDWTPNLDTDSPHGGKPDLGV